MRSFYSSLALGFACLAWGGLAGAQETKPASAATSNFTVFVQGHPVGIEQVAVERSASGITLSGSGRLGAPLNLVVRKIEIRYDANWRPLSLWLESTVREQLSTVKTTFTAGSAVSEVFMGGRPATKTDNVSPDAIVLTNAWFGGYEALTARLATLQPGAELRAYVDPQVEIAIKFNGVSDERIQTPGQMVAARRYQLTFINPGGPLDVEVWADQSARLLRVVVPAQSVEMSRDDVATVAARQERLARPGDEPVMIPGNGFNLAGTISRPAAPGSSPLPAVVLVAGSGLVDRDEMVAAVPIFAQMAGALADAGFLVVRYDKRGVGQSGGRIESATMADYAEDVRSVVKFLTKRRDVDKRRIALAGHSEGGWVSLLAASRNDDVAALALIATPGVPGTELVLEQQRHALDRMRIPEAEKQAKIELQKRIQAAVVTGVGWESIPAELRRQADTPLFQSMLIFDPAKAVPRVRQPILILQGDLDTQVPPAEADKLAELARARKAPAGQEVELVHVPGLNHLLVPAQTGEVDEYATLTDKTVSKELLSRLTSWLSATMARRAQK
jgi:hypothetical protein